MRQDNGHTINELTVRKIFVFVRPLLTFGSVRESHAHYTHLQIAQADSQTKIYRRVQFLTLKFLYNRDYIMYLVFNKNINNKI